VRVAGRLVSIADTGNGRASLRFVERLVDAGGVRVDSPSAADFDARIVIRGTPKSPEARRRGDALEEAANVVLGAARPAFARLFASACACWVNS
jgi:hypothetical protein